MHWVTQACRYYEKRFRIPHIFSDQKLGFHLHKLHLANPRLLEFIVYRVLSRLNIHIVYVGTLCKQENWSRVIHRTRDVILAYSSWAFQIPGGRGFRVTPCPFLFDFTLSLRGQKVSGSEVGNRPGTAARRGHQDRRRLAPQWPEELRHHVASGNTYGSDLPHARRARRLSPCHGQRATWNTGYAYCPQLGGARHARLWEP